jgi:hypothetical protein
MSGVALPVVRETHWEESHYWRRKLELELACSPDYEDSVREFVKLASHSPALASQVRDGLNNIGIPIQDDLYTLCRDGQAQGENAVLELLLRLKAEAERDKELLFEEIRVAEFPNLPSRRRAIFLFVIDLDPECYMRSMNFSTHDRYILEVEPLAGSRVHRADSRLLNCNLRPRPDKEHSARQYWTGTLDVGNHVEVLLEGQYRITRIVQAAS